MVKKKLKEKKRPLTLDSKPFISKEDILQAENSRVKNSKDVDIDILISSKKGDRKIKQAFTKTSRPVARMRTWSQPS